MKARTWFRVDNSVSDPSVVDIHIIDIIGDWIDELMNEYYGFAATLTAKGFVDQLAKLPDTTKTIRVHINSPGGDVCAALNIANALREQQTSKGRVVETVVDGIAASAASIIMMAGSVVRIADNGLVMVHNPWSYAVGNAADMRKSAEKLDTLRNTIVATYQWHSPLDAAALAALMDAETWMSADEAIAHGFATEKIAGLQAAASIDPKSVATLKVPDRFKARVQALLKPAPPAPSPAAATDVLRECKAAGCLDLAEELIAASATLDQVNTRVTAEQQTRAAAQARTTEITALCVAAKVPQLAEGYITGAMRVEDVRAHLTTITAALDKAEIDTNLRPDAATETVTAGWKKAFGRLSGPLGPAARH